MTHYTLFCSIYRAFRELPYTYSEAYLWIYNNTVDGWNQKARDREQKKIVNKLIGQMVMVAGRSINYGIFNR
jgi:hypothetical protein